MERHLLNGPSQPEGKFMDALFAEMVLDNAIREFRKDQIHKEIDRSLQNGDKEEFLRLTEELKKIS
jgi:uncharacterized protein YpiB (UPF0302 family)